MIRFFVSLLLVLTLANDARAQTARISAPITDVRYEITADSAAVGRRQLGVMMSFQVASAAPVILSLPAWSPGHYTVLWFARRVSDFSPTAAGAPLPWRKLDFQTWEIQPRSAGNVRVSFQYLADAVDRAVAWTSPNFAFFNGTNVFLYPTGRGFNWPAHVSVRTEPTWRVATGMDPAAGSNNFTAGNYHDLTDMPFYVGRFAIDSTKVADRWIRLAWYPAASLTTARRDRTFAWLHKFIPVDVALFGEAPFRNYTLFQRSDTVVNGGGLEHQASQVDEVLTSQLDADLVGLYSHEFFHAWNVKRLRPADLVPYRYDDAQPTTWLWVSEGVTDYYGALATVRGGVNDSTGFFGFLSGEIASVASAPPTAVSDASLNSWINSTVGCGGLYDPIGGLFGFLFVVMMRYASDYRSSLDFVMRRLYVTTYKQQHRGFTGTEWWGEVSRAANGKSFAEFARRYVDGREPLPVDSVLQLAGLRFHGDTIREPRLGIGTAVDSTGLKISQVVPAGAAAAAGARVGDQIVSIGDVTITNDDSFESFRGRYAGTPLTTIPLVVRRGTETLTLQLPVRLSTRMRAIVEPVPNASAKALAIRHGLLTGSPAVTAPLP
jgi:predicted metalloprotease with PDZ domain